MGHAHTPTLHSPTKPEILQGMTLDTFTSALPDLPIVSGAEAVMRATTPGSTLVITSPPGSGKTTLLPPLLASRLPEGQRILVTQPRKVAARAAARRIASLIGEDVGTTVGLSIRGEKVASPHMRIEIVTPGVLLHRLLRDPELPGIGGVIIDEFHERHSDTDLTLAFLSDVRETLREDLRLVLMSATLDHEPLMSLLRDFSPAHIDIPGQPHPLTTHWAPPPRGVSPLLSPTCVHPDFLAHVTRETLRAHRTLSGDILVFLPGVAEIREVCAQLRTSDECSQTHILPLHGSLTAAEQDLIFRDDPQRRIIVSTSLAESSLTVPRVGIVVDSGLSREARMDHGRDMAGLVTVPASQAQCVQRGGRAARTGAGHVIVCMDQVEWTRRSPQPAPEILTGDCASPLLMATAWGTRLMRGLRLLSIPSEGVLETTAERLRSLGALTDSHGTTPHGQALAQLPLSPAIGHALLTLAPRYGEMEAARWVAHLSADLRCSDGDLSTAVRRLPQHLRADIQRETARLTHLLSGEASPTHSASSTRTAAPEGAVSSEQTFSPAHSASSTSPSLTLEEGCALACATAFPQRLAHLVTGRTYHLAGGQRATLPPLSPLEGQQWLAITELSARSGADTLIRAALPLGAEDAEEAASHLLSTRTEVSMEGGRIRGRSLRQLGAILLSETPLPFADIPRNEAYAAVIAHLHSVGIAGLAWDEASVRLRERLRVAHEALGDPWPDVSDGALLARAEEWLGAECERCARGTTWESMDIFSTLQGLIPWSHSPSLDELTPESMEIPTGAHRRIDYSGDHPTLTLRVQEAFGWTDSPVLVAGRVPLVCHLTDPAGRPVAVTADLASFWGEPYRQVRAQLRGRYPKHPWPEDPLEAVPTSRAKPRRSARS